MMMMMIKMMMMMIMMIMMMMMMMMMMMTMMILMILMILMMMMMILMMMMMVVMMMMLMMMIEATDADDAPVYIAGLPAPTQKKVAFFAGLTDNFGPVTEHTDIVFDRVITNIGSGYSPSSGRFTAPVNGVYQFNVIVSAQGRQKVRVYNKGSCRGLRHWNRRGLSLISYVL